ncbi:MAG: ectoine hydroxylase [Alphaproteobacteria bacterium]|nr:ectoine hydroxylase [Alphaproteobacteria bacterium]MBU0863610.1 ectoine hydroxylase [Alphaproteobacteria bacterium]MBU1825927.1 ectoine hydroxylase [Alphaproteobacteria bacterium]
MTDIYPSRHAAAAEMRPRQDPVVHNEWSDEAPIGVELAAQFDRDGYIVLEDLFSDDEVTFLQRAAGKLLADPSALDDDTIVTEPQSKEIRSIFEIHQQNAVMARLAADARLADVARFLLGDEVYIHQSRLNYKPGFKGKEFYWHSDFETWHVEDGMPRMRALSMSILLAENTPHNGPLMVIPRSHKTYLTCVGETPDDHYLSSLKKQEFGVPDEDSLAELAHKHGIVAPTGKPGTVILFDCNLMHGSNGNITPFPRANAFLVYNAVSNRLEKPFGVEKPRPWFLANRGEPVPLMPQHGSLAETVPA